jgi:hypothetical protein
MMILGRDQYRLELHWEKVNYKDEIAILQGAYFSGPVLKNAQKLNEKDEMTLDTSKQYFVFVPHFYIAKLEWDGINYIGDKIYLKSARITNKYINSLPKLKNSDYFVIDTFNHEELTHPFFINYDCYLVNETGEQYKF